MITVSLETEQMTTEDVKALADRQRSQGQLRIAALLEELIRRREEEKQSQRSPDES
jgi:hypothetical protein